MNYMRNDVVEATVEIPFRSRNKYEIDKNTGKIKLNRVLFSAMGYPTEYGTIENTLAPDGDPLDILILATEPTYPGCVIPARVVGYLDMKDDGKGDYKLISVVDCDPRYADVNDISDVSEYTLEEIKDFFENYKKLENIKVDVGDYYGKQDAIKILEECMENYKNK